MNHRAKFSRYTSVALYFLYPHPVPITQLPTHQKAIYKIINLEKSTLVHPAGFETISFVYAMQWSNIFLTSYSLASEK